MHLNQVIAKKSYLGSKGQSGTPQLIIGQMRPHTLYVEPFAGHAKVFFHKRPAGRSILIDADAGAVHHIQYAARLHGRQTSVICGDAFKILPGSLILQPKTTIYFDPPYLLSTRTSRHRYQHELTTEKHEELLRLANDLTCEVLISGYPSKLYSDRLKKWRCISYRTRTRGRTVTECLWLNYAEPTELHDWRFAGKNLRQRTQLKRKATRWLARLDAMPALQRGYLLDFIRQRHF